MTDLFLRAIKGKYRFNPRGKGPQMTEGLYHLDYVELHDLYISIEKRLKEIENKEEFSGLLGKTEKDDREINELRDKLQIIKIIFDDKKEDEKKRKQIQKEAEANRVLSEQMKEKEIQDMIDQKTNEELIELADKIGVEIKSNIEE